MSYLLLKIIAIITMLTDHTGLVLAYLNLGIDPQSILLMRSIGRIAFPIFAFGIVNGMNHTSSKEKYFYRLTLFMGLSQIPFSLVANGENYYVGLSPSDLANLSFVPKETPYLILGLVFLMLFTYSYRHNIKLCLAMGLAGLFSLVSIYNPSGFVINNADSLNIFYTLGIAAYFILYGEGSSPADGPKKNPIDTLMLLGAVMLFINFSDYSYLGLILILGIYMARNSKLGLSLYIGSWLILNYGLLQKNPMLTGFSLLAPILIYFYNGQKGRTPKVLAKFFYWFYPLHLGILAGLTQLVLK